jgi:hypothetical protein
MSFWTTLLTTATGGLAGGIAGRQKDIANKREQARRKKLYKAQLMGSVFTGRQPNDELIMNSPDGSGVVSGAVGGANTGFQIGNKIYDMTKSIPLLESTKDMTFDNEFKMPTYKEYLDWQRNGGK